MSQMSKLSDYATTIATNEAGDTVITYHSTPIVTFNEDTIRLNTGGWDTVTTRRKMEQAARQFGLGYSVYCRKGVSYVSNHVGEMLLGDGVTIDRRHYANQ